MWFSQVSIATTITTPQGFLGLGFERTKKREIKRRKIPVLFLRMRSSRTWSVGWSNSAFPRVLSVLQHSLFAYLAVLSSGWRYGRGGGQGEVNSLPVQKYPEVWYSSLFYLLLFPEASTRCFMHSIQVLWFYSVGGAEESVFTPSYPEPDPKFPFKREHL